MAVSATAGILSERRPPRGQPEPASRAIISRDGERSLREELARLRHELEVVFTARLREARGFGDSHENDDYLQIKEEQAVVASRILQLERLLASSRVVDGSSAAPGAVTLGSLVEVRDVATDGPAAMNRSSRTRSRQARR
jgi:transcription elongation factor-like protein